MAGEWIKVRADLFSDPRFCTLCADLLQGPNGMLDYILPDRTEGATKRNETQRCCNKRALHDVAAASLQRVWFVVNAHCRVSGADAIMVPMTLSGIDDIAGFSGFGAAMVAAGWAREEGDNSLVFPNFCELNQPACLRRGEAKSSTQRSREHRERKRAQTAQTAQPHHATNATKCNACNGREEKRREEKKEKQPSVVSPETASPSSGAATLFGQEEPLITFPCDGRDKEWNLTPSLRDELAAAYPALDILAEARKALAWVKADPGRRKTARGMQRFLTGWLGRAQDRGAGRAAGPAAGVSAHDARFDGFMFPDSPEVTGGRP